MSGNVATGLANLFQAFFGNSRSFVTGSITCPEAGVGERLPGYPIPRGKSFAVKALSTNAGLIWIAPTKADSQNQNVGWSLTPNEALSLQVDSGADIWVTAQVAGDGVCYIVEQN